MAHKVFICHSSQDKPIADAACAALESERIPCWIAPRDILAGEEYGKAIIDALSACEIVLLIFSHDANNSPQVRREIERSVSKGKIIVPFRIEEVSPSDAMEYALSNTHWLDAITPPMEGRLADLCATISKLIERRHPAEPLFQPREEVPVVNPPEPVPAAAKVPEVVIEEPKPATPWPASTEPAPVKPEPKPAGGRGWGLIGGIAAALVLTAGGVFAYMHNSASSGNKAAVVTEATPAPAPQQPAPQENPSLAPPAAPTPAPSVTSPESPGAIAQQAKQLYAEKRYPKAFPLAKESCAQNNPEGCYLLGNMYVSGYGVASDPRTGVELIQKACQAGVPGACGSLGVLYASGDGVPQDRPKAISLLSGSCDKGDSEDCFTLGKIFAEPLYGFNRQPPRAQMLFRKACDGQVEQACARLRTPDAMPPSQPERRRRTPAS